MNTCTRSRGTTLLEIIMSLGLFTVFLTVSGQLFRSSILSMEGAAAADAGAAGIDHALAALRRDVWDSAHLESEPQSLTLDSGGDQQVRWSAADGMLTREELEGEKIIDTRRWRKLPAMTWEIEGPTVTLTIATPGGGERVALIAPLLSKEFQR